MAARVIDGRHRQVREHGHDWPILSLFVAGSYLNTTDEGQLTIGSPSAIFYRRGDAHANTIGSAGHEQIEIEFEPTWLGSKEALAAPRRWIGGAIGTASRRLAHLWCEPGTSEDVLRLETANFFGRAGATPEIHQPSWLQSTLRVACGPAPLSTAELAARAGVSVHWLTEAYRRSVGEGIGDTVRRRRVERAAVLLRESDAKAADIAVDAGFCDQSHMIRAFRAVLGRSPRTVRAEWRLDD